MYCQGINKTPCDTDFATIPSEPKSAVIADKYISSVSMRLIAFHSSSLTSSWGGVAALELLLFNQYIA